MRNIINLIFIIVITFITVIQATEAKAQATQMLQVAPARQEITLNPGEQASIVVKFYNFNETPVAGIVKVADFEVTDSDGTVRIIDTASQASPKFSASQWFTIANEKVIIFPQDKVTVQAQINVSTDARPGGRYAAVYFEPAESVSQPVNIGKSASTGIASRIASLIYIRVPGDTFEKALISRFFASSFLENGPINVETEILNRGDYHIRPKGFVSLTDMFSNVQAQEKIKEHNIFPDASRTYKNSLGSKWMLGRYRLDLTSSYGDKAQVMTRFIYVWVFPWKIALAIVLALILFIVFGKNIYKKIVVKEAVLEAEVKKEKEEIEELKKELRKKND
ncbi:MAG: hypothetical protein HYW86_05510 [Candidatus Roizmanbacteria bacterium]|nr:MAG: hypothetical protein HYW86_05510 [Candidatus Roizmanbacteria bacterium]